MKKLLFLIIGILILGCTDHKRTSVNLPKPLETVYIIQSSELSKEDYHNKVLGALVGSAIGDAMGASTEMWHRDAIQLKYGYITGLTPALRPQSPEGTWDNNLPDGSTTDDTRWKLLMTEYFKKEKIQPNSFNNFILDYYQQEVTKLQDAQVLKSTDVFDETVEKVDWIKEWARVSLAYNEGDSSYQKALNRFYGGEMSCAGQLYTPMFGLIAETPEEAYELAYEHALFDIGYAKDISALVSAMTHVALRTSDLDSILSTINFVDPVGYQNSRLVGRIALNTADASINQVLALKRQAMFDSTFMQTDTTRIPDGFPNSKKQWVLENKIFEFLEENEKEIAFHAGEIWQILITSLVYSSGNFEQCMQFIVNYGRDNDTVAAIAGMILGAKYGFEALPTDLKTEVLQVNREVLGIDLEAMADGITKLKFSPEE
ncbi:ADP-ribosylglycohydrolase family protein [Croceivirga thetidis]|uniref:ADP-ribosylglycohydrolase family protein n=1 Tax=Croceivirga thetidis TaxID=2721623 RepID=A0ABX1GRH0_9FLAO|nr:ADP-ribosylglycohydrolase family protein [Croceivirga thetidis]NKI31676.1 ADP-ribosylglycohydrolase family protein [Croceivirga thetidis]